MWEFKNKNVFGATAFSTYGGFWIGVGLWLHFIAPTAKDPVALNRDLGWILLAFAIFNTYMLIISHAAEHGRVPRVPDPGADRDLPVPRQLHHEGRGPASGPDHSSLIVIGGIIGIITSLVAWYTSAAGVINGIKGGVVFPVGKPLMNLSPRA